MTNQCEGHLIICKCTSASVDKKKIIACKTLLNCIKFDLFFDQINKKKILLSGQIVLSEFVMILIKSK